MIPVTKPFLPEQSYYNELIDGIWSRNWLTNNGPLVNELELSLKKYLGLDHLLFLNNGTVAIQIAIKALSLNGEIITTPFSYVATTSSIVWENCKPIFADIDSKTLNISPQKIEPLINEKTQAILATHCFGNACEISAIEEIAKKHHLNVIYDAAHCFGTKYKNQSILSYGDISTISFHATKLFHTVEGGGVITKKPEILKKMAFMRNFGHNGPSKFSGVGINGKNSEFHAAMGLSVLKDIDKILAKRKAQSFIYDDLLRNLNVRKPEITRGCDFNYAYYPIIFSTESQLLKSIEALNRKEIYPRRYFYPSLSKLEYLDNQSTPVSDSIANRILCLPIYHELTEVEQKMIARILLRCQSYA